MRPRPLKAQDRPRPCVRMLVGKTSGVSGARFANPPSTKKPAATSATRNSEIPITSLSPLRPARNSSGAAPRPVRIPAPRRPIRAGANEKNSRPANEPSVTKTNSSAASSESISRISLRKVGPHRTSPATAIDAPNHATQVTITLSR